ncbi:MAG: FHA domain-containing protein, partial [Polyangiaceae bacterium]
MVGQAMALTVLIKQEGEDDLALTLDAPRIVIGRSKACEVQLPDPTVSARHAVIRLQGGSNLIVDEGSTNGIAVGKVKLPARTPRTVKNGEIVRIGRVWLELRFGAGMASKPAEVRAVAMDYLAAQLRAQGEPLAPYVEATEGPAAGQRLE